MSESDVSSRVQGLVDLAMTLLSGVLSGIRSRVVANGSGRLDMTRKIIFAGVRDGQPVTGEIPVRDLYDLRACTHWHVLVVESRVLIYGARSERGAVLKEVILSRDESILEGLSHEQ